MSKLAVEDVLVQLYDKAQVKLIRTILRKAQHGNATTYERSLLKQIKEQIAQLQQQSNKLAQKLVQENYATGLQQLVADLSIDKSAPAAYNMMSKLNTNQINIIADNLVHALNGASNTVARRCNDVIRQAALQATAQKLATGQTVREMQKNLKKLLYNQNVTAVRYANGTEQSIRNYTQMVARTTTAETQNTAQLVQGNAWGYDLVRMTSHYPTCSVCAMYQGRVYATTKEAANGKYKDKNGNPLRFAYLYDTVLEKGYNTVHPNCRHRFAVLPANAYTLDELAKFSRQSMQPFNGNSRSDEERKAYSAEQAVKRKRNKSLRKYKDVKKHLPDQAPKSFAGWQRMKATKSQKYQDLMDDYNKIKKIVASGSDSGIIKEESKKPITIITDNAINKLPCISISSYTKEQCEFIQQQHKSLLKYAKENNNSKEVAFVFYDNFIKKLSLKGTDKSIGFGSSLYGKGNNLFIMHNHPRNSSYSYDDMIEFIGNSSIKTLSIVKNNGNVEVLTKLCECDRLKMIKELERLKSKNVKIGNDSEYTKFIKGFLNKYSEKGVLAWQN